MKKLLFILTLFSFIAILSCQQQTEDKKATAQTTSLDLETHPGKNLMVTNCYSCHTPHSSGDHGNRVAPPFKAIKKHYQKKHNNQEAFVQAIVDFHKNPTEEKALMKNAVEKFGLMPKFGYAEKDIRAIADFLYHADMEKSYKASQEKAADGEKTPSEKGLHYAMSTKQQLGKNLMNAIKTEGTPQAIQFCNVHAYPITDSLAEVYNLSIKRVTDKPRNPENEANALEIGYINHFKNLLAKGVETEPVVEETEEKVNFYYPIVTNTMCLQCHGEPNADIDQATLTQLASLYPNDKATGYDVNEVRGIWSISWEK